MFPPKDISFGTDVRRSTDRGWEAAYPVVEAGEATERGRGASNRAVEREAPGRGREAANRAVEREAPGRGREAANRAVQREAPGRGREAANRAVEREAPGRGREAANRAVEREAPGVGVRASFRASRSTTSPELRWSGVPEESRERPQPGTAPEPRSWRATAGRALGLARAFLLLEDPALEARRDSAGDPRFERGRCSSEPRPLAAAVATAEPVDAPTPRVSPSRPHELADPPTHPHRQPARPKHRSRRPGAAAPREQHCVTPLASRAPAARRTTNTPR